MKFTEGMGPSGYSYINGDMCSLQSSRESKTGLFNPLDPLDLLRRRHPESGKIGAPCPLTCAYDPHVRVQSCAFGFPECSRAM